MASNLLDKTIHTELESICLVYLQVYFQVFLYITMCHALFLITIIKSFCISYINMSEQTNYQILYPYVLEKTPNYFTFLENINVDCPRLQERNYNKLRDGNWLRANSRKSKKKKNGARRIRFMMLNILPRIMGPLMILIKSGSLGCVLTSTCMERLLMTSRLWTRQDDISIR